MDKCRWRRRGKMIRLSEKSIRSHAIIYPKTTLNTCKSVNTKTFTNNLNEIYQTWWTILPARVINCLTKTPTSGWETFFQVVIRVVQESHKTLQSIAISLGPYCWRNHSLQTQEPEAPELELTQKPPLWGRSLCGTRCQVCFQRREATSCSTQKWFLYTMTIITPL